MAVLRALKRTPDALVRNPVVFVPVVVLMLLQAPQFLVQTVDPLLASLVSLLASVLFIFVIPFFQGGMLGMADEALAARTSLGTFVQSGKDHYVSLLVVYLLLFAINLALGFVAFFAAVFLGVGLLSAGGESVGIAFLAVFGIVVALVVLLYLLVVFFVQFYAQAIVVDEFGAIDGLKHSVSVVRSNLLSTLGFSVVVVVFSGGLGAGFGLVSLLASPAPAAPGAPELSLTVALLFGVLFIVFGTLFTAFFAIYSVAFYREIRPASTTSAGETARGTVPRP